MAHTPTGTTGTTATAHLDITRVSHTLPDGRPLLNDVSLRVSPGDRVALIGPNGAGKTTLLRIILGEIPAEGGSVARTGELGVMRQFIPDGTVEELLLSLSPDTVRAAAIRLADAETAMSESGSTASQLAYASALAAWGDTGGYDAEVLWDSCTTAALDLPLDECRYRPVSTFSGGQRKRLALEALLQGSAPLLLLDEPDNSLDVPGKRWLENRFRETDKAVLFVSHDRELLARTAMSVVTLEPGPAGSGVWVHSGGFATYHRARERRFERLDELRRRWNEERAKLRSTMLEYRTKASYNDGMAARYRSARKRLERFEQAGPPEAQPRAQRITMRLDGGRTGRRTLVCTGLGLTGLTRPFDLTARYGDRIAVLGPNGSGKSHFLRLLAAGGTTPAPEHLPVDDTEIPPVPHSGTAELGARVRPGWFAQNRDRAELNDRSLLDILHRGTDHRTGLPREETAPVLSRYGLARSAEQTYGSLSGGQQARFRILLLELSGVTMLLLDEPTDNLDLVSAEVLQEALRGFSGTVLAVTHDRWFARDFDRFLVFGENGEVREHSEPVWE